MQKMRVTLTVQIDLNYDKRDQEGYQEKLDLIVQELEDMDFKVDIEAEELDHDENTW